MCARCRSCGGAETMGGRVREGPGVGDDGGSPQGAVASPFHGNVTPPLFFSRWVEAERKNTTHGDGVVVCVANESVVGLDPQEDADRFLVNLQARFQPFGLEAQPNTRS